MSVRYPTCSTSANAFSTIPSISPSIVPAQLKSKRQLEGICQVESHREMNCRVSPTDPVREELQVQQRDDVNKDDAHCDCSRKCRISASLAVPCTPAPFQESFDPQALLERLDEELDGPFVATSHSLR